jgi:hypothetical protein
MAGLDPAIRVSSFWKGSKTWITGTSAVMTALAWSKMDCVVAFAARKTIAAAGASECPCKTA